MTPAELVRELEQRQRAAQGIQSAVQAAVETEVARIHPPGIELSSASTATGVRVTAKPIPSRARVRVSPALALARVKPALTAVAKRAIEGMR